MGMIREYGYREYSDDLSPAKGRVEQPPL